jgi:hypothetical protein
MRRFVEPAEDQLGPDDDDGLDDVLPHGGLWSRAVGGDGLRCKEHDLRPQEH